MPTKQELYAQAQKLDIPGRAKMDKDELAAAIAAAQTGGVQVTEDPAQAERYARTVANREASIAEQGEGQKEAARLAREALANTPTAAQQAVIRAEEDA